ncbi:MAG: hypothetical protein VB137_16085 [Burkholderia sp.]
MRRQNDPEQTPTFDTNGDAEAWALRLESEMDRGLFVDRTEAERNTLGRSFEGKRSGLRFASGLAKLSQS